MASNQQGQGQANRRPGQGGGENRNQGQAGWNQGQTAWNQGQAGFGGGGFQDQGINMRGGGQGQQVRGAEGEFGWNKDNQPQQQQQGYRGLGDQDIDAGMGQAGGVTWGTAGTEPGPDDDIFPAAGENAGGRDDAAAGRTRGAARRFIS